MNIGEYFEELKQRVLLKFWKEEEKLALAKLMYEIYRVDGQFGPQETEHFHSFFDEEDESRLSSLSLKDAVETLKSDPDKMDLVYILIIDALFADSDYDKVEQAFVDQLVDKYGLSKQKLTEEIAKQQNEILTEALENYIKNIEKTNLGKLHKDN